MTMQIAFEYFCSNIFSWRCNLGGGPGIISIIRINSEVCFSGFISIQYFFLNNSSHKTI